LQTDRQTDANQFYNLSHAICYSYRTDKNDGNNSIQLNTKKTVFEIYLKCDHYLQNGKKRYQEKEISNSAPTLGSESVHSGVQSVLVR